MKNTNRQLNAISMNERKRKCGGHRNSNAHEIFFVLKSFVGNFTQNVNIYGSDARYIHSFIYLLSHIPLNICSIFDTIVFLMVILFYSAPIHVARSLARDAFELTVFII